MPTVDGFTQFAPEAPPGSEQGWVTHTFDGLVDAFGQWTDVGNAEYHVNWLSPPTPQGRVTFWAAGNAVDLSGNNDGDHVYLTDVSADPVCNDTLACTDDIFDGASDSCVFTSNCDDGFFCNGKELCDPTDTCVPADTVACMGATPFCDEDEDACVECEANTDCDDEIDCTDDTCVDGECVFTANDSLCADDGMFCNGPDVCDADDGCVGSGSPCAASQVCNEVTDECEGCVDDSECDDGLACTVDNCVNGTCVETAFNCLDDGLFCNGTESCDGSGGCLSSGDPCAEDQMCDEEADVCGECGEDADCDDGADCTTDTCEIGVCIFAPNDTSCPDDGLFCNGAEYCALFLGCTSTGSPCRDDQFCAEATTTCVSPDQDDDGVADDLDLCPDTIAEADADASGCSCDQRDGDADGVNDCGDTCAGTPIGETVDADGCAESQVSPGSTNDNTSGSPLPSGGSGGSRTQSAACGLFGMINLLGMGLGLMAMRIVYGQTPRRVRM